MKTWKIVLVAALATLAIGLVIASAFAYAGRTATAQYGTYNGAASPIGGSSGGMMRGGMMGGTSAYGANSYSAGTQQQYGLSGSSFGSGSGYGGSSVGSFYGMP